MIQALISGAALVLLAACTPGEQPDDASNAAENGSAASPSATPAPGGEQSRQPDASGANASRPTDASGQPAGHQWFTKTTPAGAWAGYGPPFSEAAFSVRCEPAAGRLVFNTTEMPPSGSGPTQMHLSAPGIDRTIDARASEEGLPNTDASVDADAQWLSRLASASGNLQVRVGGSDPLIVPISEPLRSLIEDCARRAGS